MISLVHSVDKPAVSRDFLIGQAVRCAIAESYPYGMKRYGITHVGRLLNSEWKHQKKLPDFFVESVLVEFGRLTGTYREAVEEEKFELAGSGRGLG